MEEEEEEEEEEGVMDTTIDERDECFSSPCWEVDLDYEFSAPRFYDFTRLETRDESREAEAWFETADSYPPSPYLLKLHMRANLREVNRTEHNDSVHILAAHSMTSMRTELSPMDEETNEIRNGKQSTGFDYMLSFPQRSCSSTGPNNLISDPDSVDASKAAAVSRGMVCDTGNAPDPPGNRQKALSSAPSRISTLMKPTASQLAKQKAPASNFSREVKCFNKISGRDINTHETGVEKTSCNEFQASKRQKLEGGHLRKVQQLHDRKQQATLLHKSSKKNGCTENTNQATALRLTVPREPKLETAQRARRIRAKNSVEHDEQMHAKAPLFKARPLNRKILEAPSLPLLKKSQPRLPVFEEFHLRTSERALQHPMGDSSTMSCFSTDNVSKMSTGTTTSACVDTRSSHCPSNDLHPKSKVLGTTKHVINGQGHVFKATLFNKKILLSEGDFSIYQSSKREATKPMGFNFSTDKRSHPTNPPTELFNKLSLKSEVQAHYASQTIMHNSNDLSFKMCKNTKENERTLLCREHMVGSMPVNNVLSAREERRQTLKIEPSQATGDVGVAEMSCYTFL
ncbi:protein TPX2-like isoform X3 [Nymphaea colorata]|uniref:protein TPX2-like isoform X3 n=1 Tax=Nymphaea colorata TaxID=210225 RepID=UPI00214F0292|nr:protein TPX2-like isoform X3 [Nymphaea colorata]